jgi:hypothetical protein
MVGGGHSPTKVRRGRGAAIVLDVSGAACEDPAHGDGDVVAADRTSRAGPGRGVGLPRLAAAPAGPADLLSGAERGLRDAHRTRLERQGGRTILEYWIPAEDLDELNENIVGRIEVVAEFR